MKYIVNFIQNYDFDVEANSEDEAYEIAYKDFIKSLQIPKMSFDDFLIKQKEDCVDILSGNFEKEIRKNLEELKIAY